MRFFRKSDTPKPVAPSRPMLLGGTGMFGLEVVGESHYQSALFRARKSARRIDDRHCIDVIVRREPTNPKDVDAAQITTLNGDCLGYLSRDHRAKQYRHVLKLCAEANVEVRCMGVLAGDDILGIWLDLAFPSELKKRLKALSPPQAT